MSSQAPLQILVVDDNFFNQEIARHMLESLGAQVDVAVHGQEAVDMVKKRTYDLVFMDCQMPTMDGYQATALIRQWEGEQRRTPIIAVTAYALRENRQKCMAAGMDDYLTKPIRVEVFRRAIQRWAHASESGAQG